MKDKVGLPISQEIEFPSKDFKIFAENRESYGPERALHQELEIKYFYDGSTAVMIDSDVIITEPGDITIVNPYEVHANVKIDQHKGKYYLLMMDIDFPLETNPSGLDLRHLLIAKGQKFNNHIKNDKRLATIILRVFEELEAKNAHYKLVVSSLMNEFFALMLREHINHERSRSDAQCGSADIIAPALSKIFKDYSKKLTVDELARMCRISKYHFCRIFKKEMGATVIQYITSYRISLAEAMLKSTDKTIDEIASSCGFNDVSYFYRAYKSTTGVSPKQTRSKCTR